MNAGVSPSCLHDETACACEAKWHKVATWLPPCDWLPHACFNCEELPDFDDHGKSSGDAPERFCSRTLWLHRSLSGSRCGDKYKSTPVICRTLLNLAGDNYRLSKGKSDDDKDVTMFDMNPNDESIEATSGLSGSTLVRSECTCSFLGVTCSGILRVSSSSTISQSKYLYRLLADCSNFALLLLNIILCHYLDLAQVQQKEKNNGNTCMRWNI